MKTLAQKREKFLSESTGQTKKIGQRLAKEILKIKPGKKAVVICLKGELGSGKTTFIQGLATGLGIKEKILSPTFVIMKKFGNFYHFDCYRINKAKEILELGFNEIISNPENIVAIEWPERIKKVLPKGIILINFGFIDKNKREIQIFEKGAGDVLP